MYYIVQLGAPNDADGTLSAIARSRTQLTADIAKRHPDRSIVLTGGWGAHFNEAPEPHWFYVRLCLIEKYGIEPERIKRTIETSNSVEDAALLLPWVQQEDHLTIVTSDFHVERTRFVFSCIMGRTQGIHVEGAESLNMSVNERKERDEHERKALAGMHLQGGVLWDGRLFHMPLKQKV